MALFGYTKHWSIAPRSSAPQREWMVRGNPYFIPALETVITVDNALAALGYLKAHGGPGVGIDGIGFDDLSRMEVAAFFRPLVPIILAGNYKPQPTRVVEIVKAGGGTRELRLQVLFDRLIARMMYEAVVEYLDKLFLPWSFGFRPRKSTWDLLAAVKCGAEIDALYVVTTDDIRKAFDNVPVEPLLEALSQVLPDHHYYDLIAAFVRKHGDDGKEITRGIDQGNALSPMLLNVFLHLHLDTPPLYRGINYPSRLFRYADNTGHQTRDAHEGHRLLEVTRELLKPTGMELKGFDPKKPEELLGTPVDLRDRTLPLLGFNLEVKGKHLLLGVQAQAWTELTTVLDEAHSDPDPPERTRGIIQGWVSAVGPALDSRKESITRRITRHLRETGFQGTVPKEVLLMWEKDSLGSWHRVLRRTWRNYGSE